MNTTQQTLIQIQELVKARTDGDEAELLRHVTNLLVNTDPTRQDSDTRAFDMVMEKLLSHVGPQDKAELSQRIAKLSRGPRQTLAFLAREPIEIAGPVLQYATALTDEDLLAVAREQTQKHLLAIARRLRLSPRVTDALLEAGGDAIAQTVAGNVGASFSSRGMTQLMELSLEDEALWRLLRRRQDVTAGVMDHLIRFYKHKIEELIPLTIEFVESEKGAPPKPAAAAARPAEPAPAAPTRPEEPPPPEKPRIKTTEAMLIDAARRRSMPEVVKHLAALTQVDEPTVDKCLSQATLSALMILCKANKITSAAFAALLQLREAENGGSIAAAIPHLRRYEAMHPDTARRVIELSLQRKLEAARAAETAPEKEKEKA